METQEAENKFRELQKYVPFLETFLDSCSQTKNESNLKKVDKTKRLLNILKAGFNRKHKLSFLCQIENVVNGLMDNLSEKITKNHEPIEMEIDFQSPESPPMYQDFETEREPIAIPTERRDSNQYYCDSSNDSRRQTDRGSRPNNDYMRGHDMHRRSRSRSRSRSHNHSYNNKKRSRELGKERNCRRLDSWAPSYDRDPRRGEPRPYAATTNRFDNGCRTIDETDFMRDSDIEYLEKKTSDMCGGMNEELKEMKKCFQQYHDLNKLAKDLERERNKKLSDDIVDSLQAIDEFDLEPEPVIESIKIAKTAPLEATNRVDIQRIQLDSCFENQIKQRFESARPIEQRSDPANRIESLVENRIVDSPRSTEPFSSTNSPVQCENRIALSSKYVRRPRIPPQQNERVPGSSPLNDTTNLLPQQDPRLNIPMPASGASLTEQFMSFGIPQPVQHQQPVLTQSIHYQPMQSNFDSNVNRNFPPNHRDMYQQLPRHQPHYNETFHQNQHQQPYPNVAPSRQYPQQKMSPPTNNFNSNAVFGLNHRHNNNKFRHNPYAHRELQKETYGDYRRRMEGARIPQSSVSSTIQSNQAQSSAVEPNEESPMQHYPSKSHTSAKSSASMQPNYGQIRPININKLLVQTRVSKENTKQQAEPENLNIPNTFSKSPVRSDCMKSSIFPGVPTETTLFVDSSNVEVHKSNNVQSKHGNAPTPIDILETTSTNETNAEDSESAHVIIIISSDTEDDNVSETQDNVAIDPVQAQVSKENTKQQAEQNPANIPKTAIRTPKEVHIKEVTDVSNAPNDTNAADQTIVVVTSPRLQQSAQPPAELPSTIVPVPNMKINDINVNDSIPFKQNINTNDHNLNNLEKSMSKTDEDTHNSSVDSLMASNSDSVENRVNEHFADESSDQNINSSTMSRNTNKSVDKRRNSNVDKTVTQSNPASPTWNPTLQLQRCENSTLQESMANLTNSSMAKDGAFKMPGMPTTVARKTRGKAQRTNRNSNKSAEPKEEDLIVAVQIDPIFDDDDEPNAYSMANPNESNVLPGSSSTSQRESSPEPKYQRTSRKSISTSTKPKKSDKANKKSKEPATSEGVDGEDGNTEEVLDNTRNRKTTRTSATTPSKSNAPSKVKPKAKKSVGSSEHIAKVESDNEQKASIRDSSVSTESVEPRRSSRKSKIPFDLKCRRALLSEELLPQLSTRDDESELQ